MCRALAVLCAAPDAERLSELKRALVSANWELVGGATGLDELASQVRELSPHVVVIDGLQPEARARVREMSATARIVVVEGRSPLEEAEATDDRVVSAPRSAVREAILGLPSPGGPVLS
jgi:hypothetical protein